MRADDVFKAAWTLLKKDLKRHGFSCAGTAARRGSSVGPIALISAQKSQRSTGETVLATINYGVFSLRVAAGMEEPPERPPSVDRAHWRTRVRFGASEWLTIRSTDDPDRVAAALAEVVLGSIVPDLDRHSTDEELRDEWLSGSSPGLSAMQRLLYLVILLREIGPSARLGESIKALRALVKASIHEGLVEFELKRLGLADVE
jgi:hypothetical protein